MVKITFYIDKHLEFTTILNALIELGYEIHPISNKKVYRWNYLMNDKVVIHEFSRKAKGGRYHLLAYLQLKRTGKKKTFKKKYLFIILHFDVFKERKNRKHPKTLLDSELIMQEVDRINKLFKNREIGSISYKDTRAYHFTMRIFRKETLMKKLWDYLMKNGFNFDEDSNKFYRETNGKYYTISFIFSGNYMHGLITVGITEGDEKAKFLVKSSAIRFGRRLTQFLIRTLRAINKNHNPQIKGYEIIGVNDRHTF